MRRDAHELGLQPVEVGEAVRHRAERAGHRADLVAPVVRQVLGHAEFAVGDQRHRLVEAHDGRGQCARGPGTEQEREGRADQQRNDGGAHRARADEARAVELALTLLVHDRVQLAQRDLRPAVDRPHRLHVLAGFVRLVRGDELLDPHGRLPEVPHRRRDRRRLRAVLCPAQVGQARIRAVQRGVNVAPRRLLPQHHIGALQPVQLREPRLQAAQREVRFAMTVALGRRDAAQRVEPRQAVDRGDHQQRRDSDDAEHEALPNRHPLPSARTVPGIPDRTGRQPPPPLSVLRIRSSSCSFSFSSLSFAENACSRATVRRRRLSRCARSSSICATNDGPGSCGRACAESRSASARAIRSSFAPSSSASR